MELRRTKVDLTGLMRVLGEHLYSTPHVAVRELVQNAHDSIVRRRLEASEPFQASIRVVPDARAGTLVIEDVGAGLTADEIEKYLATVGAGYTRTLRDAGKGAGLIGYFGLGFLSAFVVSDRVEVWTSSFQEPGRAWRFSSRSGESYLLDPAEARPTGTRVTLHLSPKHAHLADAAILEPLLTRYCCLLDVPVAVGDGPPVNAVPPPWREPSPVPARQRRLLAEFAARFDDRFEPLCALPLPPPPDAPDGARGVLWVQDHGTYGTTDNRSVSVFVRGMLITDDARDLLPSWAGFAGAVVESDRLSPTASREALMEDAEWRLTARRLTEALIEGLSALAHDDPATWRRILLRHNEALLGAALCDRRLFDLVAREVTLPTSEGDLPAPVVAARSNGRIHVSQSQHGGFEELLFRALRTPVVRGVRYAALPFARAYAEAHGHTLVVVGTESGDRALFKPSGLATADEERLKAWFAEPELEVVPARFQPAHLPLVLVPDREAETKRRLESDEADKRIAAAALHLARLYTRAVQGTVRARLYLNLECPAVEGLLAARPAARERGLSLLRALVGLISTDPGNDRPSSSVEAALLTFSDTVTAILAEG